MIKIQPKQFRILAIAPAAKGLGYAVLEGKDTLADWGVKQGKERAKSLVNVEGLIARYRPDVLVLEDVSAKGSRRCQRVRKLFPQITKLAATRKLSIKSFSREQVMQTLIPNGLGTKHALAEIIAKQFPEQLGFKLPPKRRPWMTENYQTGIFEAVALALALLLKQAKRV